MKVVILIIIAICVTAIYDARKIGEKILSKESINKKTRIIKIIAFIVLVICGILYINL